MAVSLFSFTKPDLHTKAPKINFNGFGRIKKKQYMHKQVMLCTVFYEIPLHSGQYPPILIIFVVQN